MEDQSNVIMDSLIVENNIGNCGGCLGGGIFILLSNPTINNSIILTLLNPRFLTLCMGIYFYNILQSKLYHKYN